MKKFISLLLAISVISIFAVSASAADIAIRVDGRTVTFREDPKPVIIDNRTYVPLRRVLEFMGAKVSWDGERRLVTVTSYDNIKMLFLTIGSTDITVHTFTSVLHADTETVTSDVAPIILDNRTMLPIRVIAETLGAKVDYDAAMNLADITTPQAQREITNTFGEGALTQNSSVSKIFSENLPKLTLSSEAADIKSGDTVYVDVQLRNYDKLQESTFLRTLAATVFYDTENFKYEGFSCITNEGEITPALSGANKAFYENALKLVFIYPLDNNYTPSEDGTILKLRFTALSDKGGSFSLSDGVSELGSDTEVGLVKGETRSTLSKYNEVFIDTTELVIE